MYDPGSKSIIAIEDDKYLRASLADNWRGAGADAGLPPPEFVVAAVQARAEIVGEAGGQTIKSRLLDWQQVLHHRAGQIWSEREEGQGSPFPFTGPTIFSGQRKRASRPLRLRVEETSSSQRRAF